MTEHRRSLALRLLIWLRRPRRGHAVSRSSKDEDTSGPRSVTLDMLLGGLLGAALAAVFLGMGLAGALIATLSGVHVRFPDASDSTAIQYYVGSFAVAGAGLGAAKPLLGTRAGKYVGFSIAGAIIMIAIDAANHGGITRLPLSDVAPMAALGTLFGSAIAWRAQQDRD